MLVVVPASACQSLPSTFTRDKNAYTFLVQQSTVIDDAVALNSCAFACVVVACMFKNGDSYLFNSKTNSILFLQTPKALDIVSVSTQIKNALSLKVDSHVTYEGHYRHVNAFQQIVYIYFSIEDPSIQIDEMPLEIVLPTLISNYSKLDFLTKIYVDYLYGKKKGRLK